MTFKSDFKQAWAFAVGIGNSLVMLYLFIKIWFLGEVIVDEPSSLILSLEIVVTMIGIFFLWKIFKVNHEVMDV